MRYLDRELSNEIRAKHNRLANDNSTFIYMALQNIRARAVRQNAQIHSFRMEHPELRLGFTVPRNQKKRMIKAGIQNLENAFNWGRKNYSPETFSDEFVLEIAGRVSPEIYDNKIAHYRTSGARITGATVTPPYTQKMHEQLKRYFECMKEKLNSEDVINLLEASMFAHLHLVRIHPFEDGNGRTSRVVQDVILDAHRLPPPIIETSERNTYYDVLDQAVNGWKHEREQGTLHGISNGERMFYNFIAGKVNTSLDKVLGH